MTVTTDLRSVRGALALIAFILVIAGMKAAGDLVLPILTALFLALLCVPPMRRLERHGVPTPIALVLVVLFATLAVLLIVAVIGRSVGQFQAQLPDYQARLDLLVRDALSWMAQRGVEIDTAELSGHLDTGALMNLVSETASGLLSALSNVFLVVLTMVFMLLEANTLPGKLRAAMNDPEADLGEFAQAAVRVQQYLAIKAIMSLATGALVGILCAACGVDFPLLWALVAFLFNFVPNIGSIIAAIPAVLLAIIQLGTSTALLVATGYLAINIVVGNMVEPRLMGQKLGLSTLIVFLSMLFWNWVWGPLGMLLSVPLTVVLKIVFEHYEDLRWLAVLLGPGEPLAASAADNPAPAIGTSG